MGIVERVEQFCDRVAKRKRGGIGLLPFYRVCCTQEAFNPAARCAHANHRVLPFINKTESSFLGCLASQKNFKQQQIGRPVSRFFASPSFPHFSLGKIRAVELIEIKTIAVKDGNSVEILLETCR